MSFKDEFSGSLRDWREWQSEAHSLRRAALILRTEAQRDWDNRKASRAKGSFDPPPALEGAMTMLNGLAIENLVKALWVRGLVQTNDPVDEKGRLIDKLKKHKIIPLLKDVNFTLSQEDEELLLRLECYVTWAGKYPMPEVYNRLEPQPRPDGFNIPCYYHNFINDEELISKFIERIEQALIS